MLYPFISAFGNEYQKIIIPEKKNSFTIINDIVSVKPINSDVIFIVDLDIWNKLPWSGWKMNTNNYISNCGLMLHRIVAYLCGMLDSCPTAMIDHKNRNRLDCRKTNIRPCTAIENGWNTVKKHGHQLKDGKWKFTFSKSFPSYHDAEEEIKLGRFQYMSKNRTCFITETFDTYQEGYDWWRFQAGIHYGEFSPFANPYRTIQEIVKQEEEKDRQKLTDTSQS